MADHTITSFHIISGVDPSTLQAWVSLDFENFLRLVYDSRQLSSLSMSSRWGCFEQFIAKSLSEPQRCLLGFLFTPVNEFHKAIITPDDLPAIINVLTTLVQECRDNPQVVQSFFSHQGYSVGEIAEQIDRGITHEELYDYDEGDDVESVFSYIQQITNLMQRALLNQQCVVFIREN